MSRRERSRIDRLLRRRRSEPETIGETAPGPVEPPPPDPVDDRPTGSVPSWDDLPVPQLSGQDPPTTPVVTITSGFHAVRVPSWITALHPNRVSGLPGGARVLVIDASAGDAGSVWAGMGGGRWAVTELVMRIVDELGTAGVVTVFRWDVVAPTSDLERIAASCDHIVAAPGCEWSSAQHLPHGIDTTLFAPTPGPSPTAARIVSVEPLTGDAVIGQPLLLHPHRLAAALRTAGELTIDAPDSPTMRHLATEATASGVVVSGADAPEPRSWDDIRTALATLTGLELVAPDSVTAGPVRKPVP